MRCGVLRRWRVAWLVVATLAVVSLPAPGHVRASIPEPPPDPGLSCPDIEGFGSAYDPIAYYSGREGLVLIFGSSVRFSGLSAAECSYPEADDEASLVDWATLEVYWASPVAVEQDRARACQLPDTERDGVGVITLGGAAAAYATYAVTADEPVDTAPFAAAARALLDQVTPLAASCDGIAAPPPPSTELPAFLAGAFSDEVLAAGTPDSGPSDAEAPAASTPAAGSSVNSPATDPSAATPERESAAGWVQALGALAAIASLALLAAAFVLVRRETRIRPAIEVARVAIIALVAVAGTMLLAEGTPAVAIVIAIALGFALGAWQGSQLVVRAVGDGWTARRTGWSVLAFAAGIALTQLAARADRVAGITLGLATTFLAAALAAGVIVGRRGRVTDARRAAGVAALLLVVIAIAFVPGDHDTRADDGDPETLLVDERGETQTALVGLVDWSNVAIRGGLFAGEAKPPVIAAVPAAFDTVPAPVSTATTWTRDIGAGPVTFSVDETYTFGLRSDGLCCTVDYAGTGTRTDPNGVVGAYEVAGRLDDIQSVAIEGSPTAPLDPDLLGVPFGEVRSYLPDGVAGGQPATADPATCARPVGETRGSYDLEETRGAAVITTYRVDGADREAPRDFAELAVTTGCDVAGFTPADALAVAPPVPPPDDPSRGVGCPVLQEVLGALVPANTFPGVDTETTARAFLEPNGTACADLLRLGQGGPGETRHELMYQFAQPTDPAFGEDSSQVDEIYWTDLPLASDFSAEITCAVDESGSPVAPADLETGCHYVDRYELDGIRVFVWTDWQTLDGPNVLVFVTAPWGSYSYRCHHCIPNDPAIGDFLAAVNALAVDAAAQVAEIAAIGPASDEPAEATAPDATADDTAGGSATTSSTTDRSEPVAVAALLGLGGAAALLGLTLGELGGWRASDAAGAGLGAESAAGDALGHLSNLQAFDTARSEYQAAGYDPHLAAVLAATEVLGGSAAGDTAPFGGVADSRLEQLSEAFLPAGVRSALVPSEVIKNNIRTGLAALTAVAETLGASWDADTWDTTALDRFVADLEARPGADPFGGYSQAFGLVFDELYEDGGVSLLQDLANLAIERPDGSSLFDDPARVTREDLAEALHESAAEFRDEVAGGKHGVVLQGVDEVFGITAELATDPVEAIGGFVDDLAAIVEHGVGDGYWTDVAAQVDSTLRGVPVVNSIYTGYQELFSGVLSHAEQADDVVTGAAQAGFAAEMAEGAAALGAELVDFVQGGDNAVRAFDYVRSLF